MGLLSADVVIGMYNAGLSPLKPSLFTPLVFILCMVVLFLDKPKFCPPAICLGALPLMRLLDVAILGRFASSGNQEMMMACLRIFIVVISMLAVLSCTHGLKAMRWAAILTILLTSGSSIAEFIGLAKFSSIPGRFSGFNGHPNSPPIVLCQCLGLCFAMIKSFRWNVAMIVFAMPGVALTYGRSGMVIFTFIAGLYVFFNARRNLGFLIICFYTLIPIIGIGLTIMQQATSKGIQQNKDTAGRLEAIYNLDFDKLKSPERAKDLGDAWDAVLREPIVGHGVGAASSRWAPHNEYVAMWLEMGVLGLVVYLLTIYIPVFKSILTGGRAGYAVLGYLAYTPIAQGRVMDPHFYLSILTIAHLLWPSRVILTLFNPSSAQNHTQAPVHQSRPTG